MRIPPASRPRCASRPNRRCKEADRLVLLADVREVDSTPADHFVLRELRRSGKPATLGSQQGRRARPGFCGGRFPFARTWASRVPISAAHGQGHEELMDQVLAGLEPETATAEDPDSAAIRIAIIGRPNVGKSTLVNRLLGQERVIASDVPGTTRDSILVPFTATIATSCSSTPRVSAVARRSKASSRALPASPRLCRRSTKSHVVIMVLDAHDNIAEQDASGS